MTRHDIRGARRRDDSARKRRLRLLISAALLSGVVVFVLSARTEQLPQTAQAAQPEQAAQAAQTAQAAAEQPRQTPTEIAYIEVEEPSAAAPAPDAPADHVQVRHYTVQPGDTLSGILDRFDLHKTMRHLLALKKKDRKLLANLRPGRPLELRISDGEMAQLVYRPSRVEHIVVSARDGGGYALEKHLLPVEKREVFASGVIADSLYLAGKKAGLSDKIIVEMGELLGWDIDFVYDIRGGDRFTVLYEESYVDGEKWKDNHITAVEFLNRKKTYRLARYTDAAGKTDYYMENGRRVRKPFLRNPLEFTRVSSHFSARRLHPVLNKVRAHRGVDYAAKRGTPVRATGDGKIIHRGRKGGYGKTVILRHDRGYSTLYAHLSRYGRGQRVGSYVKQKQVIGYVGSTGLSTGPHLHYEFRVGGVHKNPLTVKLPNSRPLPKSKRPHFRETTRDTFAKLNLINQAYVASLGEAADKADGGPARRP